MKLIYLLIVLFYIFNVVLSQNIVNFVGNYPNLDCSGVSNGVGYSFYLGTCQITPNGIASYFANITYVKDEQVIDFYSFANSDCYSRGNYEYPFKTIGQNCTGQPTILNPYYLQSSMVSFTTDTPVYEENSVVYETYTDTKCTYFSSATTYSTGYVSSNGSNTKQYYICISGTPYIQTCTNNQCTTKNVQEKCSPSGVSVFCATTTQ